MGTKRPKQKFYLECYNAGVGGYRWGVGFTYRAFILTPPPSLREPLGMPPFLQLASISPTDLGNFGSLAGIPWIIPLGILNALPMLVERRIEYTYLSWSDIILSIPFFSHQNRITSHLFSLALQTQKGAYMASGRGLGNTSTSLVEIFTLHSVTNFIPGAKLLLLVIFYCGAGGGILYLLWPMIAGICYLVAPTLYNPKPTYKGMMEGFAELLTWIFAPDETFDADAYQMIKNSKNPLDGPAKVCGYLPPIWLEIVLPPKAVR